MPESTRIQVPQTPNTKWAAKGRTDSVYKFKKKGGKLTLETCCFEMLREVSWFRKKKTQKRSFVLTGRFLLKKEGCFILIGSE